MGKKNIQPTTSSPVSRTLVVAPRPALEELRAEPQEGHISSLTGPEPTFHNQNVSKRVGGTWDLGETAWIDYTLTSYDGDDE